MELAAPSSASSETSLITTSARGRDTEAMPAPMNPAPRTATRFTSPGRVPSGTRLRAYPAGKPLRTAAARKQAYLDLRKSQNGIRMLSRNNGVTGQRYFQSPSDAGPVHRRYHGLGPVSYTHLTLPPNR